VVAFKFCTGDAAATDDAGAAIEQAEGGSSAAIRMVAGGHSSRMVGTGVVRTKPAPNKGIGISIHVTLPLDQGWTWPGLSWA